MIVGKYAMNGKITTLDGSNFMSGIEERRNNFVSKAFSLHGGKYSYDKFVYVNASTKGIITCPIHGDFMQTPHRHLAGRGCPECGKKYAKEWRKNNYCRFLKTARDRFGEKYSYPLIQSEYCNSHSKITIKCNDCGNEFVKIANDHICSHNGGCKNCLKKSKNKYYSYRDVLNHKSNGITIKPFDGKKCKNDKCTAICPSHGEYQILISTVIDKRGKCKKCNCKDNSRTITVKKFKKIIEAKYPNIKCDYGQYVNTNKKITFRCKICGFEFKRSPSAMLHQKFLDPCPRCSLKLISKERTKTTDTFKKEVELIYGANAFDMTETVYNNYNAPVKIRCNRCGKTITIGANSLLQGRNCPCQRNFNTSKMENEMRDYLSENNITFYSNDRSVLSRHNELDIYMPDYKLAVEFDGLYWHNDNNKPARYHLNKTEECERQGINLVHIFEDEWNNKREIVLSMINEILGINCNAIPVSQAKVAEMDKVAAKDFMEANHLCGKTDNSINICLKYDGEAVSLMSFKMLNKFKSYYLLSRYCNKINIFAPCGEKAMFEYFTKKYRPQKVIVQIDRRWNNADMYKELGFKYYKTTKPDYYYVTGDRRENKRCVKCENGSLNKIYDCGKYYYIWYNK